jgi:hypothetical protein
MSIYTSSYLRSIANHRNTLAKTKLFTESRRIETGFDVFLSHSYLDKEVVEGLFLELTDFGLKVYVDWIVDPQLDRNNVTKESAFLIRNRMKSSKSLLLAISTNVAMSKWMPWELGFVDANSNRCAIIPVSNETITPKSFKRVEYLLLYPYIKKLPLENGQQKLWVIESEFKYSFLENWISNGIIQENRTVNIYNL